MMNSNQNTANNCAQYFTWNLPSKLLDDGFLPDKIDGLFWAFWLYPLPCELNVGLVDIGLFKNDELPIPGGGVAVILPELIFPFGGILLMVPLEGCVAKLLGFWFELSKYDGNPLPNVPTASFPFIGILLAGP